MRTPLLPTTIIKKQSKKAIIRQANDLFQDLMLHNDKDLLRVYVELKRYQLYINEVLDALKPEALQHSLNIRKTAFDYANAHIKIKRINRFDYSQDRCWQELYNNHKKNLKILKKREKLLRDCYHKGSHEILDNITGELVTVTDIQKGNSKTLYVYL